MIARLQVAEWANTVPWSTPTMVEQDLWLSRLMVEFANHELLANELRMRGGTCLHKLVLPQPGRYSEDLDYVRATRGPAKPVFDAVRDVVDGVGLEVIRTEQARGMMHLIIRTPSSIQEAPLTIKVEINVLETSPLWDVSTRPYIVSSGWWSGAGEIRTFELDELMGTKLRALFQRSKGRDLYDLWLVINQGDLDGERVVGALTHYMRGEAFSFPMLRNNLTAKLNDNSFTRDMVELLPTRHVGWSPLQAADLVVERIGIHLKNAPSIDDVSDGQWR